MLARHLSLLPRSVGRIQVLRTMTGSPRSVQKRAAPDEPIVDNRMELNDAVVQEYESSSLKDLVKAPVSALQGVGPVITESFGKLGITTVEDLANYKCAASVNRLVCSVDLLT
jgi:predicted flap endonuclease-1-like 5' DNA nuclease